MAISPDEAYRLNESDKTEIAQIISRIDKYIKDCVRTGRPIWVNIDSFGADAIIRNAVVNAYIVAGWNLTYHSDQRDGTAYEFTKASPHQDIRDSQGHGYFDR